jgi:hypothetical protein
MDDRKLARVAVRLLRGGVAPRHVRRCVEELRSHRMDLVAHFREQGIEHAAACREADARLGSTDDFVAATLARPELRGWASRAPWLVFAALPLIAFVAIGIGLICLVMLYVETLQPPTRVVTDPSVWRFGQSALSALVQWFLPLCLLALSFLIGWRARSRPSWPALGMLLIATLGAVLTVQLVAPQASGKGLLSVGAGWPPADLVRTSVLVIVALGAIALIGLRDRFGKSVESCD